MVELEFEQVSSGTKGGLHKCDTRLAGNLRPRVREEHSKSGTAWQLGLRSQGPERTGDRQRATFCLSPPWLENPSGTNDSPK